MTAPRPPIFCSCSSWPRRSVMSKLLPVATLWARRWASSVSTWRCTCSTRDTTSPMPRMREAMRAGSKGSSASVFSPTPRNTIGLPVTWRTDSAAPPRASPSALVRMMPVRSSAAPKARAALIASWPAMASTTNSRSAGFTAASMLAHLLHQALIDMQAAGGVHDEHVRHLAARGLQRLPRRSRRAPARRWPGSTRPRPGRPAAPAAASPPGGARRC